jgi:hypothetical protein
MLLGLEQALQMKLPFRTTIGKRPRLTVTRVARGSPRPRAVRAAAETIHRGVSGGKLIAVARDGSDAARPLAHAAATSTVLATAADSEFCLNIIIAG